MDNLSGKEIETDFAERRCLDDTQILGEAVLT